MPIILNTVIWSLNIIIFINVNTIIGIALIKRLTKIKGVDLSLNKLCAVYNIIRVNKIDKNKFVFNLVSAYSLR
jgi:hypothetical protein